MHFDKITQCFRLPKAISRIFANLFIVVHSEMLKSVHIIVILHYCTSYPNSLKKSAKPEKGEGNVQKKQDELERMIFF